MHGIVLAAGLGTRLAPLTDRLPKALVPVAGVPAIDRVLARMRRAGVETVGVNAHHHADQLTRHLRSLGPAAPARIIVEQEIQGPAGGIAGFVPWLRSHAPGEPVLLHNADAATDLDLRALVAAHRARARSLGAGRLALTLALVAHPPTDSVDVDRHGSVVGFGRDPSRRLWTYSGVAVLDWPLLERLRPGHPALFVPALNAALEAGLEVGSWRPENTRWHDLGTPARYLTAHAAILGGALPEWAEGLPAAPGSPGWRIDPSAEVDPDARLAGWGVVGRDCRIGADAEVRDSVLFEGAALAPGESLRDAIVAPWARVLLGGASEENADV